MNQKEAENVKDLAPKVNKVLESLGWKWEPKIGEQALLDIGKIITIGGITKTSLSPGNTGILCHWIENDDIAQEFSFDLTPILHWEKIEEILDDSGYSLGFGIPGRLRSNFKARILKLERLRKLGQQFGLRHENLMAEMDKMAIFGEGKNRQEAVMRSIVALGEQLNANKTMH